LNAPLKMHLFYCSTCLDRDEVDQCRKSLQGDVVSAIGLPCSGKIDVPYLIKAFETGADGVIIVTCESNECRNLEGNLRAQKRADAVDELLDEIGLGRGRVAVIHKTVAGVGQIIEAIGAFCTTIRHLTDPNPGAPKDSGIPQRNTQPRITQSHHRQEIA
jgi:F420-non-reducing hydrogenase iron-sulfur subunit